MTNRLSRERNTCIALTPCLPLIATNVKAADMLISVFWISSSLIVILDINNKNLSLLILLEEEYVNPCSYSG